MPNFNLRLPAFKHMPFNFNSIYRHPALVNFKFKVSNYIHSIFNYIANFSTPNFNELSTRSQKLSMYKSFLSYFNVSIKAIIPCEGRLPDKNGQDRFLLPGYPEIYSIQRKKWG